MPIDGGSATTTTMKSKNAKLPTFLDEGASAPEASPVEATATSVDTARPDAEPELFDGDASPDARNASDQADETTFADTEVADSAPADEPSEPTPVMDKPPAAKAPVRRGRGLATILLGSVCLLVGLVTMLIPRLGDAAALAGIDPSGLLVLGTVVLAAGATWRHVLRLQARLDEAEHQRREDTVSLRQSLQVLVEAHHADLDKPPAEGEELRHVLMSMQRQDEKINNLTKAIKMYGKPLMEISGQGTELAGGIATLKALVESGTEATQQVVERVEAQLRTHSGDKQGAELQQALQKVAARVEQLANAPKPPSLEPLQQQFGRLEVTLAAVAQRLEDSEVRKSLLRLEETTQKGRESVQELLRGDLVKQSAVALQEKIEKAAKGLAEGLTKLREGQLGSIEGTAREIQREVSGVATAVSQIQAALKSGARAAAAAASAARENREQDAPAAKEAREAKETPAAKERPAAAPAPAAEAAPADSGGGYKTGARSTGSKNVLGAIAKLKQMKG